MNTNCKLERSVSVVVVIKWQLDLQLPMPLVPFTSNVVGSNPTQASVPDTILCDKVCQ